MKILLAKPGLDGHDVGVKVLARALIDAGFNVSYTGLRKSIESIVERAQNEHVDAIGLSILSGTHNVLCKKLDEVLHEKQVNIPWVVGGNIPAGDCENLLKLGASAAFPTGTTINEVCNYFKELQSRLADNSNIKSVKTKV